MLMGIQMVLTILIFSIALGTIAELQIVPVQLGPAAYSAAVMRLSLGHHLDLSLKFPLPLDLLGIDPVVISCHHPENDEIQE